VVQYIAGITVWIVKFQCNQVRCAQQVHVSDPYMTFERSCEIEKRLPVP
jgi:hypothetical protein